MEMPEGWVKLFKPSYADDDFKIAMQACGNLMKEMAEALDSIAYDLTDKKLPETEGTDLCMRALKKWEDWK